MTDKNPELEPASPQTLASVIKAAEGVLRCVGLETTSAGTSFKTFNATVPINRPTLVEAKPNTSPTVSISRPLGELAKTARWGYEITYGMQDADLSRHILVLNGEIPQGEITNYSSSATQQPLTEGDAQHIAEDLAKLAVE